MKFAKSLFMVGTLFATVLASATSITYTEHGTILTGSFGQQSLANVVMTISWTGDSANVSDNCGWNFYCTSIIGPDVVSLALSGYGTFYFTGNISLHVYQLGLNDPLHPPSAGFECTGCGASIIDTFSDVFDSYDLRTGIGPITGASYINPYSVFGTTGGDLNISGAGDSTFTAQVNSVPEPSSLLLVGSGILGVLATIRRRLLP